MFFILAAIVLNGQKSVDDIFQKYAGKDGYVNITISGDLLRFAANAEKSSSERKKDLLPDSLTEIRILAVEDDDISTENFYDKVMTDADLRGYEEFMSVNSKDQKLKMLARIEGSHIRELLLICGGDDNAIIRLKGDMTKSEARKLSEEVKKNSDLHFFSENR